MSYDVAAVGTLNADMIIVGDAPREIERLTEWVDVSTVELTPAGSMGYCAVDMARLGLSVAVISCVADDMFGEWIVKKLSSEGAEVSGIQVIPGELSGIGIYMLLFGSRKRPLTGRLATHAPWPSELPERQKALLSASRLLLLAGYLHYPSMWGGPAEKLFHDAKALGLKTALDTQFPMSPAPEPWIQHFGGMLGSVDFLLTDDVEARKITGAEKLEDAAEFLQARGPELVVIKEGPEGALLRTKERIFRCPALPPASFQDSIGAGDAFDAGLIYGITRGWDIERAARFATATASCTLRGIGGTQTAPSADEVMSLL